MTLRTLAFAIVLACALGGGAQAATCGGSAPPAADEFRGPVLEVLDGERFCVALGADPSSWVPVRLAATVTKVATAPASRGALMAASFGQDVTCRVVGRDEAGVVAECRSRRGSVAQQAQTDRMARAGEAWR